MLDFLMKKMNKKIVAGLDTSPLYSDHKVRGIGFYTKRLLEGLKKLDSSEFLVKELKNKEEIKKTDFDILHIPYFHPFFKTLPFRKKMPLVVTIHDLIQIKNSKHYPVGLRGDFFWRLQKYWLKKADLVITDSFSSKYSINRLTKYPQDRIYVTYLAAGKEFKKLPVKDRSSFGRKIKQKYHLPDTFVLYVGDVNWNKNVPGLVKACEKANTSLVIVGKQANSTDFNHKHPENKDLVWLQQEMSRENSKVIALGFVSTDDLVKIYNLAAVYCQPSFDEGFGLPILEAMACGCPVVCSDRASLPEVAGEAAIIVDPSVNSLADGIKKVLENKNLAKKLSRLGLDHAKEFSWFKTAEQTLNVYKTLLMAVNDSIESKQAEPKKKSWFDKLLDKIVFWK